MAVDTRPNKRRHSDYYAKTGHESYCHVGRKKQRQDSVRYPAFVA